MLLTVPWDGRPLHRECPNRYDLGFNVSATEPLASTVYGIRDVHLVEFTHDLGDGGVNSNHDAGDGPDSAYRLIW